MLLLVLLAARQAGPDHATKPQSDALLLLLVLLLVMVALLLPVGCAACQMHSNCASIT
jgi:hypothetical protein